MRVSRSTPGHLSSTAMTLRVSCVAPPLEPPVSPTHTRACVATSPTTHATLAEQVRRVRAHEAFTFTIFGGNAPQIPDVRDVRGGRT